MSKETALLKELSALTQQILQHFTSDSLALMRKYVALEQQINEVVKDVPEPKQEMPLVNKEKKIASPPEQRIPPQEPPVITTDVFDAPKIDKLPFEPQEEDELEEAPF